MEMKYGYMMTEVGAIPNDWRPATIGEIAIKVGSGVTPKGGSNNYKKHGRPFVRSQNVGWGKLLLDELAFIDDETHEAFSATELREGDVLLNITGASIGRSALVDEVLAGGNVNQHVCVIRADASKVRPEFVAKVLLSHFGQRQIDSFQAGGNREGLNFGQVRSIRIPLPPTDDEQKAIADALSDTDALIESLEQLIAKKRQIKRGAMHELLTGQRRLQGFHDEWQVKGLGECLVSHPQYGINAPAVAYSDRLPTYVRITDINEYGCLESGTRVSVASGNCTQYYLNEGDVVFARTGASVGKSYRYRIQDGPLVFAGFLIRVRPDPRLLHPGFLAAFATTSRYWNWVRLMSMRSGQPGINGNEYAQLPITMPNRDEQDAIVAVLSDMDYEIEANEARLAKARHIKQGMMQALLTGRIRLV